MNKGMIVLVRIKQYFDKQRPAFFVGKVLDLSNGWITIHGKGISFNAGQVKPVYPHDEARTIVYPKENIAHVRPLPDTFDITHLDLYHDKSQWYLRIDDAPDACLAEMG